MHIEFLDIGWMGKGLRTLSMLTPEPMLTSRYGNTSLSAAGGRAPRVGACQSAYAILLRASIPCRVLRAQMYLTLSLNL